MTNAAILYPLLVQVALTFVLMIWLAVVRTKTASCGEVRLTEIALDASGWPDDSVKIANCVLNQFQLPVLFYLLCVLLMITANLSTQQIIFAWIFVASRVFHVFIHTGTNYVLHRFYAFLAGFVTLIVMWLLFAFDIIFKGL